MQSHLDLHEWEDKDTVYLSLSRDGLHCKGQALFSASIILRSLMQKEIRFRKLHPGAGEWGGVNDSCVIM